MLQSSAGGSRMGVPVWAKRCWASSALHAQRGLVVLDVLGKRSSSHIAPKRHLHGSPITAGALFYRSFTIDLVR